MCSNKDFVHLHNHTHFSIQDALPTPASLAKKAREEGFTAIAITDHGKMSGSIELVEGCRNANVSSDPIKPIIGSEFYITDNRFEKQSKSHKNGRKKLNHLTLLAKNQQGYENLLFLTAEASKEEAFYYKPRIDFNILSEYSTGVIAMSGCLASEINQFLIKDNYNQAVEVAKKYKEVFGDRYYIELQYHGIEEQKQVLPSLIKIAKELDIPMVASNDVHYLEQADWAIHDVLLQMRNLRENKKPGDKMDAYSTHQFYLKSHEQMNQIFGDKVPSALKNTVKIAESIEDYFKLDIPHLLPEANFDINNEEFVRFWKKNLNFYQAKEAYLAFLAFKGLKKLGLDKNEAYVKRLKHELETIWFMGVTDYFLIQKELVDYMNSSDIFFGIRGSGIASLLNYCLSFSLEDPIKFELLFERFLNPSRGTQYNINYSNFSSKDWIKEKGREPQQSAISRLKKISNQWISDNSRQDIEPIVAKELWVLENQCLATYLCHMADNHIKNVTNESNLWIAHILGITDEPDSDMIVSKVASLPDIDTDIEDTKRSQIISWATERFGENNVKSVGTWGTYAAKSSLVGVLKSSKKFNKDYPENPHEAALRISKTIPNNPGIKLQDALELSPDFVYWAKRYPNETKQAIKLTGTISNLGTHAAAIVISKEPIYKSTPIDYTKHGPRTSYDMNDIERVGIVKYDFLGLSALRATRLCLKFIKERYNKSIDLNEISLDDSKVYDSIFKKGKTYSIFQFSSPGMQKSLQEVKASNIEDLIAVVSLFRPGPMKYIQEYAKNKVNPSNIKYIHPVVEKHLKKTFGIIVYQEQAMKIFSEMANFDPIDVEKLRKAISKKSGKDFDEACNLFRKKCLDKNISEDIIKLVLDLMSEFGGYAFNRAHATGYACFAYRTAWLRYYYPIEWFAACIETDYDDDDKMKEYIKICTEENIVVLSPDVNNSSMASKITEENEIILPINSIKGAGELAKHVVENQPYESFKDFVTRCPATKAIVQALAYGDAFSCLPDCEGMSEEEIIEMFVTEKAILTKKTKAAKKVVNIQTPLKNKTLLSRIKEIDKTNNNNLRNILEDF